MSTNVIIIISILAFIILFLIGWLVKIEMRLKRFFRGQRGKDLEEVIHSLTKEMRYLQKAKKDIEIRADHLDQRLKTSIRGVKVLRFNPFKDSGGNQSFAVALINEEGDGVVLSSLYSREKVSIFAKPIKGHHSEYELTAEEKEALKRARLS